jgi:hypothetical protein
MSAQPAADARHTPTAYTACDKNGIACTADANWSGHYRTDDGRIYDRTGKMRFCADSHAGLVARVAELAAVLGALVTETHALISKQYEGRDPLDICPRPSDAIYPSLTKARAALAKGVQS